MGLLQCATTILPALFPFLIRAVTAAERMLKKGCDKKLRAVQAVLSNCPGECPSNESLRVSSEDMRKVIGFLIDVLVLVLNTFYGKDWLSHLDKLNGEGGK